MSAFGCKFREVGTGIRNLSQDQIAALLTDQGCQISQGQVSNYMKKTGGKSIPMWRAIELAKLLDVSLDWLADDDQPMMTKDELKLEREVRRLVGRLGLQRAYDRLTKIGDEAGGVVSPPQQSR